MFTLLKIVNYSVLRQSRGYNTWISNNKWQWCGLFYPKHGRSPLENSTRMPSVALCIGGIVNEGQWSMLTCAAYTQDTDEKQRVVFLTTYGSAMYCLIYSIATPKKPTESNSLSQSNLHPSTISLTHLWHHNTSSAGWKEPIKPGCIIVESVTLVAKIHGNFARGSRTD